MSNQYVYEVFYMYLYLLYRLDSNLRCIKQITQPARLTEISWRYSGPIIDLT